MRIFQYNNYPSGEIISETEEDIRKFFWPGWKKKIIGLGRFDELEDPFKECLLDFITIYGAWEAKVNQTGIFFNNKI